MENINTELDNSINKMDNLIYQLQNYKQEYTINTNIDTNMDTNMDTNIDTKLKNPVLETPLLLLDGLKVKPCNIIPESPEYYQNEVNKFLNDICQEKEKRIQLFNKILNLSMTVNIILLAYILF